MDIVFVNSKPTHIKYYIVAFIVIGISIFMGIEIISYVALRKFPKIQIPSSYVDIYQKYSNEVNHLRDPELFIKFPELFAAPEALIYSKIGIGTKIILIQGDSWAEQALFSEATREKLEKFANPDYMFINAGTSSYSASPMTSQIRLLRKDFNIEPEIVVAIFDQTDIGDELCRYKNLREIYSGNIYVRAFPMGSNELYAMEHYIRSDIVLRSFNLNLLRLLKLSWYGYQLELYRSNNPIRCNWDAISSYLINGINDQEKIYLTSVFKDYIDVVFASKKTKKLILVSHPHRLHLQNKYIFNINSIIQLAIKESKHQSNIKFLDFNSDLDDKVSDKDLNLIYREGDLASHLSEQYYLNNFLSKILNAVK